jgi:hypothetical protein
MTTRMEGCTFNFKRMRERTKGKSAARNIETLMSLLAGPGDQLP